MIPPKIYKKKIGCIKIQALTFILKNTLPINLFFKINSPPINRLSAHVCID